MGKLKAALAASGGKALEAAPLIASLLSLPADRHRLSVLSPQKLKTLTMAALVDYLEGFAHRQPLLILVEDAQWIDPSSMDTLVLMVERTRAAAILLVITSRPEFVPGFADYDHVTLLTLGRLSRGQGAALVNELTAGNALPAEVYAQILDKTDGVPLFIEELTKSVLEADFLCDADDRHPLSGALPPLAIPSTLHDSLMARLDRLASAKEVA
jgi:predicted ATPase